MSTLNIPAAPIAPWQQNALGMVVNGPFGLWFGSTRGEESSERSLDAQGGDIAPESSPVLLVNRVTAEQICVTEKLSLDYESETLRALPRRTLRLKRRVPEVRGATEPARRERCRQ